MGPYHRGIRDRGADNGGVDPLGNVGTGAPIAPRSREEGVEKVFAGLLMNMVMPPQPTIQGKAQVLSGGALGDRVSGNSNRPRGDGAGTGEEHDLGLRTVEGEATCGPLLH